MGIGRRDFLKVMSVAMAGAVVSPKTAMAINEDFYINKKLGVIFQKPKGWGYVTLADFGELREKQIVSNISEEDLNEFWEELGGPACMITKYYEDSPENHGIFSPTIQFFVNHKSEFDDIEYNTFEEFIEQSRIGTSFILNDFKVLNEVKPYDVDGCLFYEYNAQYSFEHQDINAPLEVRLKVIIIEHNNFYYYINFHDSPEQNQTAVEEFKEFKKSLRMI